MSPSGTRARLPLVVVDAFAGVTAIGGGIALAAGLEGARFPVEWLAGTPFQSYLVPGLVLAAVVGGSGAAAAVATLRGHRAGGRASIIAGAILIGWIVGEILILTNDGEEVSTTEMLYLLVGAAMVGLGLRISRANPAA